MLTLQLLSYSVWFVSYIYTFSLADLWHLGFLFHLKPIPVFLLFDSTLRYSVFFIFILTTLNVCWCAIRKMLTQYSPTDFTYFILSECFGSILVFPSFSLSILTDIFPGEPGLAGCIEAKDDGIGGANWNYKSYKAPLRWLPPTNQHLTVLLSLFCCI